MNAARLQRARIYNRAVLYFNDRYRDLEVLLGVDVTKLLDTGVVTSCPELAVMRGDVFECVVEV